MQKLTKPYWPALLQLNTFQFNSTDPDLVEQSLQMAFLFPNNLSCENFASFAIQDLIRKCTQNQLWHFKVKVLPILQILFFRNLFWIRAETRSLLTDFLLEMMRDPQLEVFLIFNRCEFWPAPHSLEL